MQSLSKTVVATVASFLLATAAQAQTTSYEIVPHFSALNQQGGFAGVNDFYLLTGGFDFVLQSTQPARLEMVEMWGSLISDQPTITVVSPFHNWLDFENLEGSLLPTGAPFDIYQFTSTNEDPDTLLTEISLNAAIVGPWMYVRGKSVNVGCCDMFEYDFKVLARTSGFADPNEDGAVDAADYTRFRDASDEAGYQMWRSQFGEGVPNMDAMDSMMDAALASVVPEPTAALLGVTCLLFFVYRGRRRGRE